MKITEASISSKVYTVKDFIEKFHPGLTQSAIDYAILNDKIDYCQPSRDRFIVLTKKTKSYKPNKSKKRKSPNK